MAAASLWQNSIIAHPPARDWIIDRRLAAPTATDHSADRAIQSRPEVCAISSSATTRRLPCRHRPVAFERPVHRRYRRRGDYRPASGSLQITVTSGQFSATLNLAVGARVLPMRAVAFNWSKACAIDQDGGRWCWGRDSFFFSVLPFRYGRSACPRQRSFRQSRKRPRLVLILDDGGAVCESQTWPREILPGKRLSPFPDAARSALDGSPSHGCVVDDSGGAACWGSNASGELGSGPMRSRVGIRWQSWESTAGPRSAPVDATPAPWTMAERSTVGVRTPMASWATARQLVVLRRYESPPTSASSRSRRVIGTAVRSALTDGFPAGAAISPESWGRERGCRAASGSCSDRRGWSVQPACGGDSQLRHRRLRCCVVLGARGRDARRDRRGRLHRHCRRTG